MVVVEDLDFFQDIFLFLEGLCVPEFLDGYFK
jgi:hypothetical protein